MLEDSEVEGLLVRLDAPGDGVAWFDIYPSNKVGLDTIDNQKINSQPGDLLDVEEKDMKAQPGSACLISSDMGWDSVCMEFPLTLL